MESVAFIELWKKLVAKKQPDENPPKNCTKIKPDFLVDIDLIKTKIRPSEA